MPTTHTTPPTWPEDIPPSRLASTIRTDSHEGCAIALLGVPDDTGVKLNNGRPGAAQGPTAFRAALGAYGAANAASIAWPGVFDAGDVEPSDTLAATHERVTAASGELLDAGLLPVMIGGGHDLTFPFVRALAERCDTPLNGMYFDAHLDVRAEDGSGMPFRALVERCGVESLRVHGLDEFANTADHVAWFTGNGGRISKLGPDDRWPDGTLFVSFDLDVLDQSVAPGVSAMNPRGWSTDKGYRWARAAGRNAGVRCFDIMELSPPNDEQGRTARIASRIFLEFLLGYSERKR